MLLASAGETSHACKGRVAVSRPATWLRAGERVMVLLPGSIIRARRKLDYRNLQCELVSPANWRSRRAQRARDRGAAPKPPRRTRTATARRQAALHWPRRGPDALASG